MLSTNVMTLRFQRAVAVAAAAAFTISCGSSSSDPRLSEDGKVRFTGGGCTSSTTLAVGAKVTLGLESATTSALPSELGVRSDDPAVIEARLGLAPATVDLHALAAGESRIVVLDANEPLDSLVFSAEPAGLVNHKAVSRAFAGGAADVVVTEIYGDCGQDESCRLIGHGFLEWRVEPTDLGAFVIDFDGTASFRMQAPGAAQVIGREPSRSSDLVSQSIDVVAATEAASLSATLTTISFVPDVPGVVVALPGSVARPDAFSLQLEAVLMDGSRVPIARRDTAWRVEGAELAVEAPSGDDPLATLFLTAGTGSLRLVADVAMLPLEQTFDVELTQ